MANRRVIFAIFGMHDWWLVVPLAATSSTRPDLYPGRSPNAQIPEETELEVSGAEADTGVPQQAEAELPGPPDVEVPQPSDADISRTPDGRVPEQGEAEITRPANVDVAEASKVEPLRTPNVEVAGEGNVELLLVAVTSPLLSLAVPGLMLDTRCSLASIQHVSATCRRVPASSGLKDCNLKQTS